MVGEPFIIKTLVVALVGGALHRTSGVAGAGVAVLPPLCPHLPCVPLTVSAEARLGRAHHPAARGAPAGVAATLPLVPRLVSKPPVISTGVGARLTPVPMVVQAWIIMRARGLTVLI